MTLLDDIIDGASSDEVSTPNLLRKVQVAATRMKAEVVIAWARNELNGYGQESDLPDYRSDLPTHVQGTFSMPMRQMQTVSLTPYGAPPEAVEWFKRDMRQPLAEIEALAAGEEDPGSPWPPHLVKAYEESGALRMYLGSLFSARSVVTRQHLRGLLDTVRSKALEFALDLQAVDPEAGTVGGPTVDTDSTLSTTIYNVTNNIYGHGANIAAGTHIKQRAVVKAGDAAGLIAAAQAAGLELGDAEEYVAAVKADGRTDGPRTSRFLERVRSGGITLAGNVTANIAAQQLIAAAAQFLG